MKPARLQADGEHPPAGARGSGTGALARIEIRDASGAAVVVEAPSSDAPAMFERAFALFVQAGFGRPSATPGVERKVASRRSLESDPVELVRGSLARTASQRCLVLALWLEEVEGRRRWMPNELAVPLRSLPDPPKNVSDLMAKARDRGELQREPEGWCLTAEGRRIVRVDLLPLTSLSAPRAAGA